MSNLEKRNSVLASLNGLGGPLLLGFAASGLFYLALFRGPLNQPLMHRYFAGHPVSFFETAMFFVGLSALLLKLWQVLTESATVNAICQAVFPAERAERAPSSETMLASLDKLSNRQRNGYLGQRLYNALRFVRRKGAGQGLDEELKYFSDQDLDRQHNSYALARIIIWATPMLGFLGTVIGITRALGDLDSAELATNIQAAMDGLLSGLYVAFDTTALALSLSIILMFIQFLVERVESHLLASVDAIASDQLVSRFGSQNASNDPQIAAIQRMGQAVIAASEQLVKRQAQLWQTAMNESQGRWGELVAHSSLHLQENLEKSLSRSLRQHASELAKAGHAISDRTHQVWEQWRETMNENASSLQRQQQEFLRQGQMITQVLDATGKIASLEDVLNKNLQALSGSKNFEDTVMSLAAAIHLLTTRLEQDSPRGVDLRSSTAEGRAA